MPVEIRYAVYGLVHVDSTGNVLGDKASLKERASASSEFRVFDNTDGKEGGSAAPNSADFPKLAAYLEAEAADGFAVALIDQTQIITQMIT